MIASGLASSLNPGLRAIKPTERQFGVLFLVKFYIEISSIRDTW
jgi:hypothetical protein